MSLRIIFMGTPEFSVPTLQNLKQAGHEIVAVYSQPPRPGGRRDLRARSARGGGGGGALCDCTARA